MKHIIFAIGSVLIGYRWQDMLMVDHGMPEEAAWKIGRTVFNSPYWSKYDAGLITTAEMIEYAIQDIPELEEDVKWFFEH